MFLALERSALVDFFGACAVVPDIWLGHVLALSGLHRQEDVPGEGLELVDLPHSELLGGQLLLLAVDALRDRAHSLLLLLVLPRRVLLGRNDALVVMVVRGRNLVAMSLSLRYHLHLLSLLLVQVLSDKESILLGLGLLLGSVV